MILHNCLQISQQRSSLGSLKPIYVCVVFTYGSSNNGGSRVGLIREREVELTVEVSQCFKFPTTDSQAEYEGVITGLSISAKMGIESIKLMTNFQLIILQIKGECQTKEPMLQRYVFLTREKLEKFKTLEIRRAPRENNIRENIMSKLVSTRSFRVNHPFIQENLRSIIIESLRVMTVGITDEAWLSWITPITMYIKQGTLHANSVDVTLVNRKNNFYSLV